MNSNSVTLLVPVFNLMGERLNNFKFILNKISKLGKEVLVVEQLNPKEKSNILDICNIHNVEYLQFLSESDLIEKSKLINFGSREINTEYVWITDADAYVQYESIINQKFSEDVIQPYNYAKKLTKEETDVILSGNKIDIKFKNIKDNKDYISHPFGLSCIFRKKALEKMGWFDEKFIGWGYEDSDLAIRLYESDLTFKIIHSEAVHLWHPNKSAYEINSEINLNYFLNKHSKEKFKKCLKYYSTINNNKKCNIITLFRGNLDFLYNIDNYICNENFCIPVNFTWVINSDDEKFIKEVYKKSEKHSDVRIIHNKKIDITNNYWDSRHEFIGNLYSKLFKNNRYDYIITLEDDIIPPQGSFNKLLKTMSSGDFVESVGSVIGGVGTLYECKAHPNKANFTIKNFDSDFPDLLRIKNTGRVEVSRIGGGYTLWNKNIIDSFRPITITKIVNGDNIFYEGWDWFLSKNIVESGHKLIVDTDIVCEHLI